MTKKTVKRTVIEIAYETKSSSYFLKDHGVTIAKYTNSKEIVKVAKKFENDDNYTVKFTRI
jgi:hypothetical protein